MLNLPATIAKQPTDLSKLDSSIKRNSAFVKKLKNLTETTKDAVLKDITSLNLSKYLTEVVAALVDLKLKASEIGMYLEICSRIHRMYPEFQALFMEQWQRSLPKTSQEITNYTKLRNDLRIFSELILIGIFALKDSLQVLGNLLKLLLNEKQTVNLNVVLNFCKSCGWYYAGLMSKRMLQLAERYDRQLPNSSFLPTERQKNLRTLLKDYYGQICKQVLTDHRALKKRESENKQLLITRGELSDKKKSIYEENKNNFQKLWASVQQLSELLNEDLPELPSDDAEADEIDKQLLLNIDSSGIKVNSIQLDAALWESEFQRSFYEVLPNMRAEIPAHLYRDSIKEKYQKVKKDKKEDKQERMDRLENKELIEKMEMEREEAKRQPPASKTGGDKQVELSDEALAKNLTKELINDESDEDDNIENALNKLQLESDDEESAKKPADKSGDKPNDKPASIATANKEQPVIMKVTLDELLSMLLNCVTKETIDKAAYNFCLNFNTKNNRKKLIRHLFTCPRTRLDLLPFFARFVAIVSPIMPLVGADLVYLLKKDFRFHLNKKDQINIESKIKTMRFIGELTKFDVFPKDEALQCLKILILDFSHHQIEMACSLLESCGRYLFLSPATHIKCSLLLQQMLRKKALLPIQTKYISMIENAYYNSCPNLADGQLLSGDGRLEPEEPLSDVQLYFKHLIQKELDRKNLEKVGNRLRKFDYTDAEFTAFAVRCLSEPWSVNYFNIKYLANCLSAVSQFQPKIGHQVVDSIFEDIRLMIEINSIKYHQRRMAVVRYLGELYNYRTIDSAVIINALYLLISYGVNQNYEAFDLTLKEKARKLSPASESPVDEKPPNQPAGDNAGDKTNDKQADRLQRSKSLTELLEINEQLMSYGESDLDLADNLIRVRLISLLMDTCVPYINTSSGKRKLECFILFFQLYFYRKKIIYILNEDSETAVFPPDVEFLFVDSVRKVKPKFKFSKNYNDAFKEVSKLVEKLVPKVAKLMPKSGISNLNSITEADEEENDESCSESDEADSNEELDESNDESDAGDEQSEDDGQKEDEDEEEVFENTEEDDEFQREFDAIMSESLASRSTEHVRSMNTDIVIPISKLHSLNTISERPTQPLISLSSDQPSLKPPTVDREEKTLKVVVMTKSKNNKQILKAVQVPLDSDFARSRKEKEKAEREEKERVGI